MLLTPRTLLACCLAAALHGPALAGAESNADALALARAIAERPANEGRVGTMHFKLQNRAGDARQREALMFHSDTEQTIRIAIFFTQPAMISETAFLSFDHRA